MRNSVRAFLYYLKKDSIFKYMTIIILSLSIVLALFIGNLDAFSFDTILYPLNAIKTFSVFLFFIFPIYFCFFSTEGFESGTIKILISSGISKKRYISVKFLFLIGVILFWSISFLLFYLLVYAFGSILFKKLLITSSFFKINSLDILSWSIIVVTLIASSFLICSFGLISRKLSTTAILTFFLLFGDFMFNGYFKDSKNNIVQILATNTISANIMKISGNYIINEKLIQSQNFLIPVAISLLIIFISFIVTYKIFVVTDID